MNRPMNECSFRQLPEISAIGAGRMDTEPASRDVPMWLLTVKLKPPMKDEYLWAQVALSPAMMRNAVMGSGPLWRETWSRIGEDIFLKLVEQAEGEQ